MEAWRDDTFYAFYKEPGTLAAFTNTGTSGESQTRTLPVGSLPEAWRILGTTICSALDGCSSCAVVDEAGLAVTVKNTESVAVFTTQDNCS